MGASTRCRTVRPGDASTQGLSGPSYCAIWSPGCEPAQKVDVGASPRTIGIRTVKTAPPPDPVRRLIVPPWAATIEAAMERPRPGTAARARPRAVRAVEALEDLGGLLVGQSGAGVRHLDQSRLSVGCRP